MDYWDPLEWLVRSPRRYIGDKLYFRAVPEGAPGVLGMEEAVASAANSPQAVGSVLAALCAGDAVECEGEPLGGAERKVLYESFMLLHEKASRGRRAETGGGGPAARPGRRRKPVDELMLREAIARYRTHESDRCEGGREHRGGRGHLLPSHGRVGAAGRLTLSKVSSTKLKENLIGIDLGFLLRRMWC